MHFEPSIGFCPFHRVFERVLGGNRGYAQEFGGGSSPGICKFQLCVHQVCLLLAQIANQAREGTDIAQQRNRQKVYRYAQFVDVGGDWVAVAHRKGANPHRKAHRFETGKIGDQKPFRSPYAQAVD